MSLALAMRRRAMGKAVAPFSPADISGLLLWLKADAITGLANDAPVATWPDSSGFGRDATQAAVGAQPLYKASSMNGKPALAFDGNDWLESVQNCNTKPTTVISVVGVTNFTTTRTVIGASTNALQHRIDGTSGKQVVLKQGEIGVGSSTSAIDTLIPTIVTFTYGATGVWAFYRNGVADGQGTNDQVFGSGTTIIGSYARGVAELLLGRCAEILKYDRVLTAAELTDVHNHLKAKYRIGEVLASDGFNRANSTTTMGSTDDGKVWVELAGAWGIDTNRAYSVGGGPPDDRQVAVEAGQADGTVEVDLSVLDTAGGAGLLFRGVDALNYWICTSEVETPRWALYKRVAGTYTLVSSLNQAMTTGRLSVVAAGSSITCKLDGVTLMSATDTAHQTATRHGLRVYRFQAASAFRFDNFKVAA